MTARFFEEFRTLRKAELHLHLEGAVRPATVLGLSRRNGSGRFPDAASFARRRRFGVGTGAPGCAAEIASAKSPAGSLKAAPRGAAEIASAKSPATAAAQFLAFYRDVCLELKGPADYALLARDLVRRLAREGTGYAEVYVSPAIVERMGFAWRDVAAALEPVFARAERRGVAVRVLLDSVRHWGPDTAQRVLDRHRETPWPRVVGFGLGGDEASVPAQAFRDVYRRVRALGLAPLVHAGEWCGADSVAEALRWLRPVRIAHGVRAAEDPALVRRLARSGIALDVCLASNRATGAVTADHPALRLLRAGVPITLSTDDPGLFGTSLRGEYLRLARLGATDRELRRVARLSLSHALSTPS